MRHPRLVFAAVGIAAVTFSAAASAEVFGRDATVAYASVLERSVNDAGLVDYSGLRASPAELRRFVAALAELPRPTYESWPGPRQIAFWINAYNALTLQTIVESYPIEARGLSRLRFPASSIRQIDGAWTSRDHVVLGERVSLDHIEHEILRREFDDPRVHMALVCAALGCPPLRNEPYEGDRLDEQLDDQARRYLASPAGLHLESERRVEISEIFKWFGGDFAAYADRSAGLSGVQGFVARYAPAAAARAVRSGARLGWIDYDWTLNDQAELTDTPRR